MLTPAERARLTALQWMLRSPAFFNRTLNDTQISDVRFGIHWVHEIKMAREKCIGFQPCMLYNLLTSLERELDQVAGEFQEVDWSTTLPLREILEKF